MKLIFRLIGVIGVLLIFILVFNILNNPFEVVPSVISFGYDKPIWINLVILLSFFYIIFLCNIYDILNNNRVN